MNEQLTDSSSTNPSSPNPLEPEHDFDRFARFYDNDYRHYDDDIDLLLTLADQCGGSILELGSGTGRALLPLVMQGHKVTGVDISASLSQIAYDKIAAAGYTANVDLVEADMCQLLLPDTEYAFAYCVSNTLMHCSSPAAQLAVMDSVYQHLRPGGRFLIDLFNPDIARLLQIENVVELADSWQDAHSNAQVLKWSVRSLDIAAQLQDTLFIYEEVFPTGETKRTPCAFQLRFLWQSEGELMLRSAGFEIEEVWGDFDGGPYSNASERLIFLARKP